MKVTDYPERRIITWRAYTHRAGADKYSESFWMAVSNAGDSDRGLAVFFIWRETAVESDDNIVSHPSRFFHIHVSCPQYRQRQSSVQTRVEQVFGILNVGCVSSGLSEFGGSWLRYRLLHADCKTGLFQCIFLLMASRGRLVWFKKKKSDCIEAYWCEW